MSDDINKMLADSNKGAEEATGELSRLFRKILADRNVTPLAWDTLMYKYVRDPRNDIPANGKDRSSARGNMNKELRRANMTWRVFMKGLRFLRPVSARFEVHLTWRTGKTSVHGINLEMERYQYRRKEKDGTNHEYDGDEIEGKGDGTDEKRH